MTAEEHERKCHYTAVLCSETTDSGKIYFLAALLTDGCDEGVDLTKGRLAAIATLLKGEHSEQVLVVKHVESFGPPHAKLGLILLSEITEHRSIPRCIGSEFLIPYQINGSVLLWREFLFNVFGSHKALDAFLEDCGLYREVDDKSLPRMLYIGESAQYIEGSGTGILVGGEEWCCPCLNEEKNHDIFLNANPDVLPFHQ